MNTNSSHVGTFYNLPTEFAISISSEVQFVFVDLDKKVVSPLNTFNIISKIIGSNVPKTMYYQWSVESSGEFQVIAGGYNLSHLTCNPSDYVELNHITYKCELYASADHASNPNMVPISYDIERISILHDLTSIRAELTNDMLLIPCKDDFTMPVLGNAVTKMIIYQGMNDISDQFHFSYTLKMMGSDDPNLVEITQGELEDENLFSVTGIDDDIKQFYLNIKAEFIDEDPNDEHKMIFEKNCYVAKQGAPGIISIATADPYAITIGPTDTYYDATITLKKNAATQVALIESIVGTNCSAVVLGDNPDDPVTIRVSNFSGISGKVTMLVKEGVTPFLPVQTVTLSWSRPYLTKYYIKPLNGTAIKNKTGSLSFEARVINASGDNLVADNNIQLALLGESGFVNKGHEWTCTSADILGSTVLYLINTVSGAVYDTASIADITDGHGFVGWVETPQGIVIKKNKLGAIIPATLTLAPKFTMDGALVGPGTAGFSFTAFPSASTGITVDGTTKVVTVTSSAFAAASGSATVSWTAQLVKNGVTYSFTVGETFYVAPDGIDGDSSKSMEIHTSHKVLYCDQIGEIQEPLELTAEAKLSNIPSNTPIIWTVTAGGQNVPFTQSGTSITIGATALGNIANTVNDIIITASLTYQSVSYTDTEVLSKVLYGKDAISADLTNDRYTVPLDNTGIAWDHSGCTTQMNVFKGLTDDTSNWTFAITQVTEDSNLGDAIVTTVGLKHVISGAITGELICSGDGRGSLAITNSNKDIKGFSVTITASKEGHASISKKFAATKTPMGGFAFYLSNYEKLINVGEKGDNPNPTEITVMAYLMSGKFGVQKRLEVTNVTGCTAAVLGTAENHTGVRLTDFASAANKSLLGGSVTIDAYWDNTYIASQVFNFTKVFKNVDLWSIHMTDSVIFTCDSDGNVLDASGNVVSNPENTQNIAVTYGSTTPTNDGTIYALSIGAVSGCTATLLPSTNPTQLKISGIAQATKSGYAVVNLTAAGSSTILATRRLSFTKSIKGDPAVNARLSLESVNITTDKDGNNGNYSGAVTTMSVSKGLVDDSANWTFASSLTSGTATFTRSNSNRTLSVTAMTTDSAVFTLTATKGTVILTKTFTVAKTKQGIPGNDGAAAKMLKLTASSQMFYATSDGTIQEPASIDLSVTKSNIAEAVTWSCTGGATLTDGADANSKSLTSTAMGSNTSVTVTASVTSGGVTYTDKVTVVKIKQGAKGTDAVVGFLTNESHTIATDANGGGPLDYIGAGGQFQVYFGITDVTSSCAFSIVGGTAGTKTQSGLTMTITSGGSYYLSGSSWSSNTETFTLRAVYNTVVIDKVFTITKAKQGITGAPAKNISLSASAQSFKYNGKGIASPADQTITIKCTRQNIAAAAVWTTTPSVTLGGSGDIVTITDAAFGSNNAVTIRATADGLYDEVTIIRVVDGKDAINGYLTNETHNVTTDANGNNGVYTSAGGTFKVFDGASPASAAFSVASYTPGLSITIDSGTGVYTVTGLTVDNATATLRAVCGGVTLDKVYTIAKSKQGSAGLPAKSVKLSASANAFSYNASNAADPSSQTISFTASRQNISTAITWSTTPSVTLSTSGDTASLTVTNFGSNTSVKVRATADGLYDEVTIFRIKEGAVGLPGQPGTPGQHAVTGFLTNEVHTVPTDVNGNGGDYSTAGGSFKVFEGLTDKSASTTFSLLSASIGLTISINSAGVYSITGLTANIGTATLRAVYNGVTIDKVYTISKSRQGLKGDTGDDGIQGPKGDDGQTTYFHIAYANDASGSGFNQTSGPYTGTYVDFNPVDSTNPADYHWVLTQGLKGEDGIPGQNGADGRTSYLHIKYSDDGSTFTSNNGETPGKWIGQYVDFTQADSLTFSAYTWKKIEGPIGPQGLPGSNGQDGVSIIWKGTYTSHPANPVNGWAYYNSTQKKSYVYNGAWYQMTQDGVNGQNGLDGISISWRGELSSPPATPQLNWVYRDTDDGIIYIWNGSAWAQMVLDGNDGSDGADGQDGLSVYITYHDNPVDTAPATPTGNGTLNGWHTAATAASVWMSQKIAIDANSGVWGTPIRLRGFDGLDGINGVDGIDGQNGVSIIWQGTFASHPSNPQNGWAYYNSATKKSYIYQSGTWYQMTVDGVDGQNGANGISIVWKGESSTPPLNPQLNWIYRDTDNGMVYIWNGSAWVLMVVDGNDGQDGADGQNGMSVYITYHDNPITSIPSTPTGDGTTNGWHTAATNTSVWMSQKIAATALDGTWGNPIRIKGDSGVSVIAQYSANSISWHDVFVTGDIWMRTSTNSGTTWTPAIRIVGEKGDSGNYIDYIFIKSTTTPGTPTGNIPSGWSGEPPATGDGDVYMSKGEKTFDGILAGSWSTPVKITGPVGPQGQEGSGPAFQGEWNESQPYGYVAGVYKDVVEYDGGKYAVKISNSGKRPDLYPDYWEAIPGYQSIATDLILANNAWVREMVLGSGGSIHSQGWTENCAQGFFIDATTIRLRGGSLVGTTIKTKDSGQRVEIDATGIKFFNDANNSYATLTGESWGEIYGSLHCSTNFSIGGDLGISGSHIWAPNSQLEIGSVLSNVYQPNGSYTASLLNNASFELYGETAYSSEGYGADKLIKLEGRTILFGRQSSWAGPGNPIIHGTYDTNLYRYSPGYLKTDGYFDAATLCQGGESIESLYASKVWIGEQGFLTTSNLTGYATEQWVAQQIGGVQDWVEMQGYLTSVPSEYATKAWVGEQGYLTATSLTGYATQTWVTNQGYLTSVPSTYATQTWVTSQGYLTSIPTDYATKTWVGQQGYLTTVTSHGDSAHSVTYAKQTDLSSLATRVAAIENYLGLN